MKSGFPFLLITLLLMLLVSVWRREGLSDKRKWVWTIIMLAPSLVSAMAFLILGITPEIMLEGLITNQQPFTPPWNRTLYMLSTYALLFIPFSGIFAWLLIER